MLEEVLAATSGSLETVEVIASVAVEGSEDAFAGGEGRSLDMQSWE